MCTVCSTSIKSSIKGTGKMKKFLKFKKIKSVGSQDLMNSGIHLLLALSVFAIARLIHKMSWFQKLSATTQNTVDWVAILGAAGLNVLAEHPYIKTVGLAGALAAIYNKFGEDVDAQVKKIFNIAGWDASQLRDPYKRREFPQVASDKKLPQVACNNNGVTQKF